MSKITNSTNKASKALFIAIAIMALFALSYELTSAQITLFNTSLSSLNLTFTQEFMTKTFFVRVPNGTVAEARMRIQGFNMQGLKGLPRDVIIVTDLSGSMGQAVQGVVKLVSAQAADRSFISNVDTNYIQVGLVNYSTVATLNQPLITNKVTLDNSINNYRVGSYTNLGAALQLAINELNSVRAQRVGTKKYILLMTDGWPNCLSSGSCADNSDTNRAAEAWILSLARTANSSNITIFAISFGGCGTTYTTGGGGTTAHCSFMQNVSNQTKGGLYFNASTGQALIDIYNNISEIIETTNLTTPTIRSTSPSNIFGWSYPDLYNGNVLWNGASCGSGANCNDFRSLVQDNLAQCTLSPCDIRFSVYSLTVGMLNLSELFIEINVPPVGNYPPIGNCLFVPMLCDQDVAYVGIDDENTGLVTDANDPLNTLTWRYNNYLMESSGGSHFTYNNNFNTARQLAFLVDSAYLQNPFWRTFFFNISDPWGASTMSCINVSYAGCALYCGNNVREAGEQCEPSNNDNNPYCSQQNESCVGPQLTTRPDIFGNCNNECQCYNDSWSAALCVASKCGAICSDGQTQNCPMSGGFPGIRACNITTCQWNICRPLGVCGDGTINQAGEQCEPNNNENNQYCQQDNESCDESRLATRPDRVGNCDNICECYNDSWSTAICTANKCGAECSYGETQNCPVPGGFPGIQDCNATTCQWNTCTALGSCGDGTINQQTEQCEPNDNQKNSNCYQDNESCDGPRLATRPDQIGYCNGICECYNDSWSTAICTANKCGAECSDGQTRQCPVPGGFPGIQACNITTCQWNTCTPTGKCGDGTINQQIEQCERNNTVNNAYCNQDAENCTDAPKARTRDLYGNCNANCGCVNDTWSEPICIAGICGAICTNGTSQPCNTIDGYPGTQTCDETNCNWNICTTTLSCGDNIITNPPESCELPSTNNNTDCNQSIEQCFGPKIAARDSYGDCSDLCTCAYDVFGEALNCSVAKCGASCDATTPPEDCNTGAGHEGTRTCDLATCTMGDCIPNPLHCESSIPNYLLHTGQPLIINLSNIFNGDTGGIISISHPHISAITINDNLPSSISITSNDATLETVNIRVTTDEGVDSDSCNVTVLNLDSKCDNPICEAYADSGDFEGLNSSGCLDNEIWVTDPYAPVRVSDYISSYLLSGFTLHHLTYAADFTTFDGFGGSPSSGTQATTFYITNLTNITHGTENGSVIKITFDEYHNPSQDYVRICPKLKRFHYYIGELSYEPNSTLLIAGSRAVTGYYEKDGFVFSKGPYIFIAKVWMKE